MGQIILISVGWFWLGFVVIRAIQWYIKDVGQRRVIAAIAAFILMLLYFVVITPWAPWAPS